MAKFESKYEIGEVVALEGDFATGRVLVVYFEANALVPQYTLRMRGGGLVNCGESELVRAS